jgi:ABC-type lipoprotein release transport system permease subunit
MGAQMNALGLLTPIAWRNLWRNPRRTLITLAVVAVGVWSILAFDLMFRAWIEASRQEALRLLTGEGQIHAAGYLDDPGIARRFPPPGGTLKAALDGPAGGGWAPRLRVPAIVRSEYRTRAVTFVGVSAAAERRVSDLPGQILAGRYLAGPDDQGLVIGADLADKLKTRLGKRVIIMTQAADGALAERSFQVVGLFGHTRAAQDEFVFAGLPAAQAMTGAGEDLSEIAFDAAPGTDLQAYVARLRRSAPGLDVQAWTALAPLAYTMQSISGAYIGVWLTIVFVLMAIGVVNTLLMAVFERRREFGLLQALGMRPGQVLVQVLIESAWLIGLGVTIGVALAAATVAPFPHGIDINAFSRAAELSGSGGLLKPHFDLVQAGRLGLIVWVLGVVAAVWPAWTAARADPVSAMGSA